MVAAPGNFAAYQLQHCIMLELKGIRKAYRTGNNVLQVLKGIDLHIAKGELVSIMGSSGSGKSTLLNTTWMVY